VLASAGVYWSLVGRHGLLPSRAHGLLSARVLTAGPEGMEVGTPRQPYAAGRAKRWE
jgi:hypothetical protein